MNRKEEEISVQKDGNKSKRNKRAINKWTQAKREGKKSWKLKRKRDNENVIKETP